MESIFEKIEIFGKIEIAEEIEIHTDMYKKCKNVINYICKFKTISPECIKLLENCEKFKKFQDSDPKN